MGFLFHVTEEGFRQLYVGIARLDEQISELNSKLSELEGRRDDFFNVAKVLQPFFKPEPQIVENNGEYIGTLKFEHPITDMIEFSIGKTSEFEGENDPNLKTQAKEMAKKMLKEKYSNYF